MTSPFSASIPIDDAELLCPACDYPLRGLQSDRCPECGTVFDRTAIGVSQIPWVHRKEIGLVRAFFRTARIATAHPDRIAKDVALPVSLSDALRFRRAVVVILYASILAAGSGLAVAYWCNTPHDWPPIRGHLLAWMLEAITAITAIFSLWLFLLAATGTAGYFFHPRSISIVRQNRAVALSHYACAPLAFAPIPATAILLEALLDPRLDRIHGNWPMVIYATLGIILVGVPFLQIISWYRSTLILLRRTTHCTTSRLLAAAVTIPVGWLLLFTLIAVGIPAVAVLISLVILSVAR